MHIPTDQNELDVLVVMFHPEHVSFRIHPELLLSNYSIPASINAIVLIIRPLNSTLVTLGDITEAKIIYKGVITFLLHNTCMLAVCKTILFNSYFHCQHTASYMYSL